MWADRIDSWISLKRAAERVQQAGAVTCPDLNHSRGIAGITDQLHVGAGHRATAVGPGLTALHRR